MGEAFGRAGCLAEPASVERGEIAFTRESPLAIPVDELPPGVARERRRVTDHFRAIFNGITDGILIFEPDGRIVEANRVASERLGYEPDELVGMNVRTLGTHASAEVFDRSLALIARQGQVTHEMELVHRDGRLLAVEVASRLIELDGGPAILSVHRDITERRRAAAQTEAQRQYTQALLEAMPATMISKDTEGRVLSCNSAFLEVIHRGRDEVLGRTIRELGIYFPDFFEALDREVMESGEVRHSEAWMPAPNGPVRRLFTVSPVRGPDGGVTGVITTAIDITERYLAEQRLRQSEERFRAMFDSMTDGICIADLDGRVIQVNRAAAEMLGYSPDEMVGMLLLDTMVDAHPGIWDARVAELLERGVVSFEATQSRRDGTPIPMEVRASAIELEGRRVLLGIARDVSERKRAEAERAQLERQLRQAQKMEGIGQLASGIAHDFNNLLTAVSGFAGFAMEGLASGDPRRLDIEQIQQAARRGADLVHQLLQFSRTSKAEPAVVAPVAIVAQLERLLRPMIGEQIELTLDVGDCHSHVLADPGQLEQVVVNFAVNARDAMPRGGHLRIRLADVEVDEDLALACGGKIGPNVLLQVIDDGTGMSRDTMSHLFEPFFTTKEPGEGTGLGLATVYGIVRNNWGGGLLVESELGRGSVFSLYLPRVEAAADGRAVAEDRVPGLASGAGRRVLVVEDDEIVRRYAVRVLQGAGYRVLAPETAPLAVQLGATTDVDLVLTDMVMPAMLGAEVASDLARAHPGLPVIYMSGYSDRGLELVGDGEYLAKPFTAVELLQAVEKALLPRHVA